MLSGLSVGNYTMEVYFRANGNDYDFYDSGGNSSYNYRATFAVVPEPVNFALLAFAACFGIYGLRRRFHSTAGADWLMK